MSYPTKCPHCEADLTAEDGNGIITDEMVAGTASGWIDEDGNIEWEGSTRMCWSRRRPPT